MRESIERRKRGKGKGIVSENIEKGERGERKKESKEQKL